MKFLIAQSKKRAWTNKSGREALNVDSGYNVKITLGNKSSEVSLSRAPASAARIMRALHAHTGLFCIAVDRWTMQQLGAKPGDTVQVTNASIATVQRVSNKPSSTRRVELVSGGTRPASLKSRLEALKVGEQLEVSESAAKSGAYSVAKEVGIKIKKMGPTLIKRVE